MRNDEGGGCLDRRQDRGIMTKRMLTAIMLLSTPAPPDNAGYTGKGNLIEPPPPPSAGSITWSRAGPGAAGAGARYPHYLEAMCLPCHVSGVGWGVGSALITHIGRRG